MEENLINLFNNISNENILEKPENFNTLYLAYIGDTIFDLFTRDYLIKNFIKKYKMEEIHKKNSNLVCAKSQARIVETLIDNNILSDKEKEFYTHARNVHSNSKSKNSSIVDYRKATGFEAILGLLFYTDIKRLMTILENVENIIKEEETKI